MKINESLNLVIPIGERQAYHTPISREVFEANYRLLASVKSSLGSEGVFYQIDAGPKIAALSLKDSARKHAEERGDVGSDGKGSDAEAVSLLAELKRLTVILCPTEKGWESLPVDVAISKGQIDADDWREAESAIVFFTCIYSLTAKASRPAIMEATSGLLKGLITSLPPSEFVASLPGSTTTESPKKAASSVPS